MRLDGRFEYAPNALIRTRETDDQVGMEKTERTKNIQGSFATGKDGFGVNIVCRRDVIIFDDVVTTGATLREAQKVTIEGGARRVLLAAMSS